jgi:DNA-binding MarR family transcriptional regulator
MSESAILAESLRDFFMRSHRAMDRLMAEQGASFARTKLLLYIAHQGPVRSTDLANAFGHAPRTITEAVDGLERDGFVQREADPQDRRAKRISITEAGAAAIECSEPMRREFTDAVFNVLDPGELLLLAGLMDKLTTRLRQFEIGGWSALKRSIDDDIPLAEKENHQSRNRA